jgi:Rieske Fe-S protein
MAKQGVLVRVLIALTTYLKTGTMRLWIRVRYEYNSYAFVGCENMKLFDVDAMLFDLDGLLVDTEQLHWKAYRQMCEHFGCRLDWEFPLYLQIAAEYTRPRCAKNCHGCRLPLLKP